MNHYNANEQSSTALCDAGLAVRLIFVTCLTACYLDINEVQREYILMIFTYPTGKVEYVAIY